ncbi:MAG: FAD-dependent oxidoreductase [Rhodothermales bacterium]
MPDQPRILIVGAGPTGLGAAWRINELGHENWTLYEAADRAGGLAASVVDENGFTWDLGGHVLFSHYKYFDRLMDIALADQWIEHEREAWVWMRERWIPYPFQYNIWRLPHEELVECLDGLLDLKGSQNGHSSEPGSFQEWLLSVFGDGLCDTFMFPYNRKVWAYEPRQMNTDWMGERVPTVDLKRVLRNLVYERDDVGWGPNATFRFPLRGGTGAIWKSVAGQLPEEKLQFGKEVVSVDEVNKIIGFSDGSADRFDYVISTMPLNHLLRRLTGTSNVSDLPSEFVYSSSHIVGIGLAGSPPEDLASKCWIYFPEDDVPCYRVTVFSNYSPYNVPNPGAEWSLMAEVSESDQKPVKYSSIVDDVICGFKKCGFIDDSTQVESRFHHKLEQGYPTPWLGRNDVLERAEKYLRQYQIFSRGRFGAWKYEVSNQDHSVMQGVEAVNLVLLGEPERTYYGDMSDD